jgi:integrase
MKPKGDPVKGHPEKGSVVTIEPLRSLDEIARVKGVLKDRTRDLALFTLGINTNLRATDLLTLTAADVDWMESKLCLREGKTGKKRTIPLDAQTLSLLAGCIPPDGEGLLFPSGKSGKPLTMSAWNGMIKTWCEKADLKGNYGARTIRKTWARMMYEYFSVDIVHISLELQHSSLRDTYLYMGITPPETAAIYRNFL